MDQQQLPVWPYPKLSLKPLQHSMLSTAILAMHGKQLINNSSNAIV
jgi:hypothetical protein